MSGPAVKEIMAKYIDHARVETGKRGVTILNADARTKMGKAVNLFGQEEELLLPAIMHQILTTKELDIAVMEEEAFLEHLDCLDFFYDELTRLAHRELTKEVSDAALHGDWEYLAAYIEGGQEITLEMRPTIVAALRQEKRIGNPPKARSGIESYGRAAWVVEDQLSGRKLARAKETALHVFDVSDTTLKKDMKEYANGLRAMGAFHGCVIKYTEHLTAFGVRKGWIDSFYANWLVTRAVAQSVAPKGRPY